MSSLRRTVAGNFSIADAYTIDEIRELAAKGELDKLLLPVDTLFSEYPSVTVSDWQMKKCLCGNSFETSEKNGKYRVYDENGGFLMLGNVENGIMSTVKSFFEV